MIFEIFTLCTKYKSISWLIKYDHSQCLSAFWPDDLDVYMRQFPPQRGTWHNHLILKVTSCGRKCAANKLEPGSAHDHRHIMTSPGPTGISRRDIQTSAPHVLPFARFLRQAAPGSTGWMLIATSCGRNWPFALISSREMSPSAGAPGAASRRGWFVLTTSGAPGDSGATSRGAPFRVEMGTFLF